MFELIKPGIQYDFVGKRYLWIGISLIAIIGTGVLFFTKGLNYGIDFTGGAEVYLKMKNGWEISRVRDLLEKENIRGLRIQQVGDAQAGEFIVRAQGDEKTLNEVAKQVEGGLLKQMKTGDFEIQKVDIVGPAAGGTLRKRGFTAMLYALLVILGYVAFRFDVRYAPGAVIALIHDSVVVMGIFILTDRQFDLTILAAILALIGYSNNDTIIVFDRVRETLQIHPKMDIAQAVNRSINETLGRTLVTSLCTFIVCFALWMFGGSVLENFAFTLMVGIVVGTYSSIFIASSLVIEMTRYRARRTSYGKNLASAKS